MKDWATHALIATTIIPNLEIRSNAILLSDFVFLRKRQDFEKEKPVSIKVPKKKKNMPRKRCTSTRSNDNMTITMTLKEVHPTVDGGLALQA